MAWIMTKDEFVAMLDNANNYKNERLAKCTTAYQRRKFIKEYKDTLIEVGMNHLVSHDILVKDLADLYAGKIDRKLAKQVISTIEGALPMYWALGMAQRSAQFKESVDNLWEQMFGSEAA